MKINRLASLCLTLTLSISLQSQTLEQCWRWAEENYPLVSSYDLVSKAEKFDLNAAANAWIPRIVLSGQATLQSDVVSYPDEFTAMFSQMGISMEGISKDQYKLALDVDQTIWDGGVSKANRELASSEAAAQSKSIESQLYALREKVNGLYFGILLLQEQKALAEDLVSLLESNIAKMSGLTENGVAMESDMQILQAELLKTEQNLSGVEASRKAYVSMLSLFTGHEIGQLSEPVDPGYAAAGCLRPELEYYDLKINVIDAQKRLLDSSLYPRFSLFAQGYYGSPGLNMFEDMMERHFSWNAIAGVRMQWNISSFFTRRNDMARLDNARQQVKVERNVFEFNNSIASTEMQETVAAKREVVSKDEKIISLRRSVREAYEARLDGGVVDVNDLLAKISDENQARISAAVHRIELLKTLYDLQVTLASR